MTILDEAERVRTLGESVPRTARDAVNLPMINNWVEALGDANPVYVDADAAKAVGHDGPVAPPAMIQVWTMGGLHGSRAGDDPLGLMMTALDAEGFTSIVATNCEQTYRRYLRHGEELTLTTRLEGVVGPKRTALGEGYFVTTRNVWYSGDEPVAEMVFRVLKYAPAATRPAASDVLRPVVSLDTAFFWEGTAAGELRVQRCTACGALRHPPGPMCMACGSDEHGYVVASGRGTVYSYVVHHHPRVPGKTLPFVVALVELDDLSGGVKILAQLVDVDPASVHIDMPVELALTRVDDELTLPFFSPPRSARSEPTPTPAAPETEPIARLPRLVVEATPTFVVSTAIATRDFQDVHHDRDRAIARGSKDIFVNILTDTGLVQRYVTDWAGRGARVHSIAIRLGVPCYAYDTLEFSGAVTAVDGEVHTVDVVGRGQLGDHVVGTVQVSGVGA